MENQPNHAKDELPLVPVVEFKNVSKVFNVGTSHEFKALDGLTFRIEDLPRRGELITVLGPSGCGKSTMLNLLAGFQGVYPQTTGEIFVRGETIKGPGKDRGMVFQKYSSFPHMTVLENVSFGLKINKAEMKLSDVEIRDMAMDWINKVGLAGHEHKYPRQLSGGQQQRVAIARSLVLKPRILLMDEPFSALDEPTRMEMQRLLVDLWYAHEATVFMVTHSIAEAVYLGDRLWLFSKAPGKIVNEFNDLPLPKPGESPVKRQKEPAFQSIVDEVAVEFMKIQKSKNENSEA